jgi:hypothetical protein
MTDTTKSDLVQRLRDAAKVADQEWRRIFYSAAADEIADLRAQLEAAQADAWRPIETAPESGYMLVYEDGAIRALLRHPGGRWEAPGFPALVNIAPPGMEYAEHAIVGEEAARFLRPHNLRLALRDGCCESPTHWMPLPAPPVDAAMQAEGAPPAC